MLMKGKKTDFLSTRGYFSAFGYLSYQNKLHHLLHIVLFFKSMLFWLFESEDWTTWKEAFKKKKIDD